MHDPTRLFRLRDEERNPEKNVETVYGVRRAGGGRPHEPFDAERLFIQRYPCIRPALERYPSLGVLIMVFDERSQPIAEAWLEASLDRARAVVVGRHSTCPILLPGENETISLRHLAIIARATSHTDVRIRVVDLATSIGFADETGRTLENAAFDGPMFFSVCGIRFVVLVTGTGEAPLNAADAYRMIPARILVEERLHHPPRQQRTGSCRPSGATQVRWSPGPLFATGRLLGDGEFPDGVLTLAGSGYSVERRVSRLAVSRGILMGRYSRCDVRTGADNDRVSRVHALLLRDGPDLWMIDTASTNGTWKNGTELSLSRVLPGDVFDLGGAGDLSISWATALSSLA